MLNDRDIKQLEEKGISKEAFLQQIDYFKTGFPPLHLDRPATVGDGILQIDTSGIDQLVRTYDYALGDLNVMKFVPASGAATRMFKDLFVWRDLLAAGVDTQKMLDTNPEADKFFSQIKEFAFWEDLAVAMDKDDLDADHLLENQNFLPILDYLLYDQGLDYAALPKALIAFHDYGSYVRTPLEEHLVEGARYAADDNGLVRLHFTLSQEHVSLFREKLQMVQGSYEQTYNVQYEISHSVQKPSTDTIAVDMDNLPFREQDGTLYFRPGGHGALIDNLNDLDADLVFIKNIDNVVPDRLKEPTIEYKKVLGGVLLHLQQKVFDLLRRLDSGDLPSQEYDQAVDFAVNELNIDRSVFPVDVAEGSRVLRSSLNRPLRVCGMVKNEGEPGGGPFWVSDRQEGFRSLQIVEKSQIDLDDPHQAEQLQKATHFNPVDLVCSIKDYQGNKYNLKEFIDHETGFISQKSKDGKDLKALERPGLWNGAMAYWNTQFVELPLSTFSPVKILNDLLRDTHQ